MNRLASFVLVGAALTLAAVPVSTAAQPTAQRQQSVRFLLASNGAPPTALDVGRTPVLRQRLTLDLQGVTVREALTAISDRAHLVLWYTDDVIAADRRVNLRADEITVAAALTDVLVDAGVDVVFNRDGSAVIVKRLASVALVQVGAVTGRVTDSISREGVGGVAITVEGTRLSTTTAADGGYTIRGVPAGNRSITARRLGFVRQSRAVTVADNESATVDFVLVRAPTTLSEVVSTATGDQRRVELGHVVGRINADSVVKAAPVSSISELLNGRVAGLQVNTYQGTVGGEVGLRIRTPNTIQLSTEPIVIVDGIRYTGSAMARINLGAINSVEPTSPLNDLNPNEIESIEIVKGPSASTLYGTDAANGVIVITTKRGKPGPARWNVYMKGATTAIPQIDYADAYWGWHTLRGVPAQSSCSLLSTVRGFCTQDSVTAIRNPLKDPEMTIFAAKPRWEYGGNVSGGSASLRYFFAGELEQAIGPLRMPQALVDSISLERPVLPEQIHPNALSKVNLRSNVVVRLGTTAELEVNGGYNQRATRTLGAGVANSYAAAFWQATPTAPFGTSLSPDQLFSRTTTEHVNRLFASTTGHWSPTSWFRGRIMGGVDLANIKRSSLVRRGDAPRTGIQSGFQLGSVAEERGRQLAATAELSASASFSAGPLSTRTSIGAQYVRTIDDMFGSSGTDIPPGASTIGAAARVQSRQSYREQVTLGSYVEQQAGLNQRLFLTGALRVDGASTFGRNYHAAVYPKGGVSWLVSQEPMFPRLALLDDLRLRYAFGASGQQPRPEWARPGYAIRQAFYQGAVNNVYTVSTLGNPNIRPERVREHEFGFDASMLQNRVGLELTWYRRKTIDQIVGVPLPPGLGMMQTNLGLTTARGFEAQISARLLDTRALNWYVAFQHSFHRTILQDLGGAAGRRDVYGGWVEGYPLGARFVLPLLGYDDKNGDSIIDPDKELRFDTLVYAGESTPPRSQALTSSVAILNGHLRFTGLVERRSGFTQLNSLHDLQCGSRLCRPLVDRNVPLAEQAAAAATGYTNYATLEPGDFIRLRELGVAIDLPGTVTHLLRLSSAALALQGRNLAIWTSYSGADPESATMGSRVEEIGIPQGRIWVLRFDFGI